MAKPKVIAVANQKGGVGKSTSVYNIGAGLAMNGKNILLIDVDPQGDLTKMLGQRKPHDLPVTLGNALNDVVADTENSSHPEILRHHEGFDFVPANRTLSAVEVSLVNVMSRETVLRRYVNSVKKPYDYVLLDCNPSLGIPHGRITSRASVPMILATSLIRSSMPCALKMWAAGCLEAAMPCGFSARKTRTAPFRATTARNSVSVSTKGGTAS